MEKSIKIQLNDNYKKVNNTLKFYVNNFCIYKGYFIKKIYNIKTIHKKIVIQWRITIF